MPLRGLAWGIGQAQREQGVQNWIDESEFTQARIIREVRVGAERLLNIC